MKLRYLALLPMFAAASMLAGCGGGGGGDGMAAVATVAPTVTRGGKPAAPPPPAEEKEMSASEKADQKHMEAVKALEALADDATDEVRLAAQKAVLMAAMEYRDALQEEDASYSAVAKATEKVSAAELAVNTTQDAINDAEALATSMAPLGAEGVAFQKAMKAGDHNNVVGASIFAAMGLKVAATTDAMGNVATYGKFKDMGKLAPKVAVAGWRPFVHERSEITTGKATHRKSDDVTTADRVTVYTTQEDPADEYFAVYYAAEKEGETTGVITDGVITLQGAAGSYAASRALPTAGQAITYDGAAGNPPAPTGTNRLSGTFREVPGKFSCTLDCTATADSDGKITLSSGWKFTPTGDPAKLVVKGVINDMDYLTLGHWVRTTTDSAGSTYMVGVFANGTPVALPNVDSVTGTAEYAGPAIGLFSKREYAAGGKGDVTMTGQFTAAANLVANFDVPSPDGSITGTIGDFMHRGAVIDEDWKVSMKRTAISGGAFSQGPSATGTDGSVWAGNFYGVGDADDPTVAPKAVAGTFDHMFDNGDVLGAFGAMKK